MNKKRRTIFGLPSSITRASGSIICPIVKNYKSTKWNFYVHFHFLFFRSRKSTPKYVLFWRNVCPQIWILWIQIYKKIDYIYKVIHSNCNIILFLFFHYIYLNNLKIVRKSIFSKCASANFDLGPFGVNYGLETADEAIAWYP